MKGENPVDVLPEEGYYTPTEAAKAIMKIINCTTTDPLLPANMRDDNFAHQSKFAKNLLESHERAISNAVIAESLELTMWKVKTVLGEEKYKEVFSTSSLDRSEIFTKIANATVDWAIENKTNSVSDRYKAEKHLDIIRRQNHEEQNAAVNPMLKTPFKMVAICALGIDPTIKEVSADHLNTVDTLAARIQNVLENIKEEKARSNDFNDKHAPRRQSDLERELFDGGAEPSKRGSWGRKLQDAGKKARGYVESLNNSNNQYHEIK